MNSNELVHIKKGHIGVIKEGTVHVKSHSLQILSPFTIARLDIGAIIGHKSDDGLTTNSENWLLTYSDNVEIVWFAKE